MTPTQARAFHAVALAGSISGAARELKVSQPTLTSQVRDLENSYGVELFHRHRRGVTLSATGQELLVIVRRMIGSQRDAVDFLEAIQGLRTGELRIGAYGSVDVVATMAAFRASYPGIRTSLAVANSKVLLDRLIDREIDVAVFSRFGSPHDLYRLPYSRPRLILIVGHGHPWRARSSAPLSDLNGQTVVLREAGSEVRRIFELALADSRVVPSELVEIGSRDGVIAAVARGMGIAPIFDEGLIPDDMVHRIEIGDQPIETHVDVVCLAERRRNRAIEAFLELAGRHRPLDSRLYPISVGSTATP
jgi:aminoethylphosphonate catabolism LysR family transcriptional regulator